MNKNEKIVVITAATYIVVSSATYLHIRRTERKKRAEIDAAAKREIHAIHLAALRVRDRIRQGEYNDLGEVLTDYKFEQIAILTEE